MHVFLPEEFVNRKLFWHFWHPPYIEGSDTYKKQSKDKKTMQLDLRCTKKKKAKVVKKKFHAQVSNLILQRRVDMSMTMLTFIIIIIRFYRVQHFAFAYKLDCFTCLVCTDYALPVAWKLIPSFQKHTFFLKAPSRGI